MKQIDVIAAVLVVVGALNWGLVAVARFDSSQRCSECSSVRSRRPVHSSTDWWVWPGCIRPCRGSACRTAGRSPRRWRLVSESTRNSITEQKQMKKMIAGLVAMAA